MGTKASDDLFQLITSLSASEKRAFKLLSERHSRQGGNNYLLLFDAIAAQPTYDEAAIKAQFKHKAFTKNLAEAKSYLYKTLLRSLRFSKGPGSPETELREMLDHLEILHAKGLGNQAEKQVQIGLQKAQALNLHAFIAEFLRWKRRLLKWRGDKRLSTALNEIGAQESEALKHQRLGALLRDLKGRIQAIMNQQIDLRDQFQAAALEEIWQHEALHEAPHEAGFHALSAYYYCHANYHRLKGQLEPAMNAWMQIVATFEENPAQIKRQQDQYTNALVSLIDLRISTRNLQPFHAELQKLASQKAQNTAMLARIFFMEHHLILRYALVTGHLDDAIERVPDFEAGMLRFAKFLSGGLEMTFLFNICVVFFLAERYPEAQKYINMVLNRPHLPIREDISDALKILEMVGRYSRGQIDLLEHLHKAHERRLKQLASTQIFGMLSVKFIGQLLHASDAKETKALIAQMHNQLDQLPADARPAGFEELQLWVRSRQAGKPITEILQADSSH